MQGFVTVGVRLEARRAIKPKNSGQFFSVFQIIEKYLNMYIYTYIMKRNLTKIFKALGDETRLQIVEFLLFEEQCACDFTQCINKDQTTVSRHLKILVESGLLISKKNGRNIIYKIKDKVTKNLLNKFGLKPNNICCNEVNKK